MIIPFGFIPIKGPMLFNFFFYCAFLVLLAQQKDLSFAEIRNE
jgi:hypothetical protein